MSCLQQMENGVKTGRILKTVSDFTVETGRTYHLKVIVSGTKVKCFVDGDLLIDYDTAHPAEAEAYHVVSRDAGGDIILKLVNVTDQKKTFAIKLKGVDLSNSTVSYTTLTGDSLETENGELTSGTLEWNSAAVNYTVTPRSVTVVRITP